MSVTAYSQEIERIIDVLKRSNSILFITGAGMSADSGLPTYRGIGGLYENQDTEEGIAIEEALSGGMIRHRPDITWKYISQIESGCREASYNRGHEVIAEMEKHFYRAWILTQNVDGFHLEAGSKNVIDIHGDVHNLYCLSCDYHEWVKNYQHLSIPPKCPKCAALVRPDVVLFDEVLPMQKLDVLYKEMAHGFDIVFSIGTTSLFPYIAEPVLMARQQGDFTVEINPGQTAVSENVNIKLPVGAAEALDYLWKRFQENQR